ncbi:hypothetical protein BDW72DRAFT_198511 [Aspergillus terricola var. indicus]
MKAPLVVLASCCINSSLVGALPSETTVSHESIGHDKAVLVPHDSTTKTVEKKDLELYLGAAAHSPPVVPESFETNDHESTSSERLSKRSGAEFIIPLPDAEFLGWDIPMSTVVHANEADATVAMAQGQSIANSISVGTSFTATVEKFLQVGTTINYQWTETATLTGTVTMTIPKNRWGAIVSNPLTFRKSGYVFRGQPGSAQYEYFQADSFTHDTYSYGQNSLSWVKGVVTTCLGNSYPLKRCLGEGEMK